MMLTYQIQGLIQTINRKNMNMTIRVKASQFDSLMVDLEALGEFTESKNISMRDVTEQFIDVEAKLKHKKASGSPVFKDLTTG